MADTQQTEGKKPKPSQGTPKGAKDGGAPKGGEPKVKKPRERSDYVARLKTHYEQVIRDELSKKFGYTNRMQVPTITKIATNRENDFQGRRRGRRDLRDRRDTVGPSAGGVPALAAHLAGHRPTPAYRSGPARR